MPTKTSFYVTDSGSFSQKQVKSTGLRLGRKETLPVEKGSANRILPLWIFSTLGSFAPKRPFGKNRKRLKIAVFF